MCSSLFQLAPGSRDLPISCRKKNISLCEFAHHYSHCLNVSTTPLQQWGFWQCLPFSLTTLRRNHCWHPIAVMGFVDISGILFSVWDKSHNPGANWSKLEHKQTTFVHMQSFIKGQTKLKFFFSSWRFFQKTNKRIRFFPNSTIPLLISSLFLKNQVLKIKFNKMDYWQ